MSLSIEFNKVSNWIEFVVCHNLGEQDSLFKVYKHSDPEYPKILRE